jgi:hypothetical protein
VVAYRAVRVKDRLSPAVLDELLGHPGGSLVSCRREPITGSSGAATGAVTRLTGTAQLDDQLLHRDPQILQAGDRRAARGQRRRSAALGQLAARTARLFQRTAAPRARFGRTPLPRCTARKFGPGADLQVQAE